MGRKTYEVGLKDGVTSPYSHMKQYVFSQSMKQSPNENVKLISENAIEFIKALKNESGKGIWLCGGGNLATALFTNYLIDQLNLLVPCQLIRFDPHDQIHYLVFALGHKHL